MGNPDCHYDDCQGSASCVEGRWEVYDVSCNPPPLSDECPALLPEYGSSCSEYALGLTCDYEYCYESMPLVRCNELGAWEELPVPTCNPPPPDEECSVVPVPGSDCASEGVECLYDGCEGPGSSYARCEFGQWFVHYSSGPACNPPAVVPVCPVIEPQALAGCAYEGQLCDYGDCAQAELTRQFTCATGSWQRVDGVCGGAP